LEQEGTPTGIAAIVKKAAPNHRKKKTGGKGRRPGRGSAKRGIPEKGKTSNKTLPQPNDAEEEKEKQGEDWLTMELGNGFLKNRKHLYAEGKRKLSIH